MSLLVADASPIVAFVAADLVDFLLDAVESAYKKPLLLPHQVDVEVGRVLRGIGPKHAARYAWARDSGGRLCVLAEQAVGVGDPHVSQLAYALLDTVPGSVNEKTKNAGEAFTVAHAASMRRKDATADVLIDDGDGRRMAKKLNVPCVDTYWVFQTAVDLNLIGSKADLRKKYAAVSTYLYLNSFESTGLLDRFNRRTR